MHSPALASLIATIDHALSIASRHWRAATCPQWRQHWLTKIDALLDVRRELMRARDA